MTRTITILGGIALIALAAVAVIVLRPKPLPALHLATAATQTPSTTPTAALPEFHAGTYTGIRPAVIDFSGDGGNIVGHIHWSVWNTTEAVGIGTVTIEGCRPNCAQGSQIPEPDKLVLSNPAGGQFSTIVDYISGRTVEYQSSGLWALSASRRNG